MIKLAIIGLGSFGKKYIETIQRDFTTQIELVAACRQKNERPEWLPPSCHFYTDWRKMSLAEKVDGIIVAASPYAYPIVKDLLHLGYPVMAEKPIVLDTQSLEYRSFDDKKLLVNYIHLFSLPFMSLQKHLNSKNIISIETQGFNNGPIREYSSLFDYGTHDLSMILSILQDFPTSIQCRKEKTQLGELFYIDLKFNNGIMTHSVVGNGSAIKTRKFIVYQSKHCSLTYDNEHNNPYLGNLYETRTLIGIKETVITKIPIKYDKKSLPLTSSISNFLNLIEDKTESADLHFGYQLSYDITKILAKCEIQCS